MRAFAAFVLTAMMLSGCGTYRASYYASNCFRWPLTTVKVNGVAYKPLVCIGHN